MNREEALNALVRGNRRHKCRNCRRVRLEKFMMPFIALEHGVPVKELYPNNKHGRQQWECGDCGENQKSSSI